MKGIVLRFAILIFSIASIVGLGITIRAQSSDQNYPTAVTTNEINGVIKARDIGDPRLTTYFYEFDGVQGDIFINVVSKNLTGDIDIFAVDGLRPLAKMVIYAETDPSETGRLVYLRKPERLLLRVEGRSPNDDAATFRIKFGGSFVALAPRKTEDVPKVEETGADNRRVRVNSVGTIIKVPPKPQPTRKVEVPRTDNSTVESEGRKRTTQANRGETPTTETTEPPSRKPVLVVEDNLKPAAPVENTVDSTEAKTTEAKPGANKSTSPPRTVFTGRKPPVKRPLSEEPKEKAADPLANVRLVVELKDGSVIEKPLNEVMRFAVTGGIITVVGKDGSVKRYSMVDVAKVTIQ
jgi:hypothetical protein